jgi:hypothetical protein
MNRNRKWCHVFTSQRKCHGVRTVWPTAQQEWIIPHIYFPNVLFDVQNLILLIIQNSRPLLKN